MNTIKLSFFFIIFTAIASCKKEKINCNCTSTNADVKLTKVVETTYSCSDQTLIDTINNQAQTTTHLTTQTTCIEQ